MKRLAIRTGMWALCWVLLACSALCAWLTMFGRWAGGYVNDWLDALDDAKVKAGRDA